MEGLVRKSFYIHVEQARMIAEHIFESYLQTGRRLTESEVVREALILFFKRKRRDEETPGPLTLP